MGCVAVPAPWRLPRYRSAACASPISSSSCDAVVWDRPPRRRPRESWSDLLLVALFYLLVVTLFDLLWTLIDLLLVTLFDFLSCLPPASSRCGRETARVVAGLLAAAQGVTQGTRSVQK